MMCVATVSERTVYITMYDKFTFEHLFASGNSVSITWLNHNRLLLIGLTMMGAPISINLSTTSHATSLGVQTRRRRYVATAKVA